MISPEQAEELVTALEPIYLQINSGHKPWRLPLCKEWSRRAKPVTAAILGERAVARVACNPSVLDTRRLGLRYAYHEYLVLSSDTDEPLVIDGTWQQFGVAENADAPRLLIAPPPAAIAVTRQYGVSESYSYIWRPDAPVIPGLFDRIAS